MTAIDELQPIPVVRPPALVPLRTRLRRWLAARLPRPLTPGELAEREAERKSRAKAKAQHGMLLDEARTFASRITRKLTDLNICYRKKKSEQTLLEDVQEVQFRRPFVLTEEAIYLEVDLRPGRSPRGVGVDDLGDEKVLKNLSLACEHPVYFKYGPGIGAWYIVERETGKRGIPAHVKYDDMIANRPASADGLSLPIGIGENKKPIYRSLGQMYSMLVAGTIGGGKSNFLSVMLCTLLRFNSPRKLKLMLVDLKGGMEFAFFQGVPHLLEVPANALKPKKKGKKKIALNDDGEATVEETAPPEVEAEADEDAGATIPAIIEKREHVPGALRWLIREGERRMQRMKEKKVKTIGQYNFASRKHPLPHIVVVVDEWADVKLDKDGGREAEESLINIASRFRAVGIHVILCTQVPNKEVVSIRIKNVLPARIVFNCPDQYASMLVLGDAAAHGLEPAGRSFFVWGGMRQECQTPYINNATVDKTVEQAIAGHFNDVETATHDVTDQEILEWALTQNNGELSYRTVYNQFRLRGLTQPQAKAVVASYRGEKVVIGASTYSVKEAAGSKGSRLIPDEDEEPEAEPTPAPIAETDG